MRGLGSLIAVLGLGVGMTYPLAAPILGTQLLVRNPKPEVDATKR